MPSTDALALFIIAGLALNVTPGPDMLYVIARSTSEGRAAGVASRSGSPLAVSFTSRRLPPVLLP